ncbi:MAG: hypothetical protein AAF580_07020 [Pseudomonadota bacterium]
MIRFWLSVAFVALWSAATPAATSVTVANAFFSVLKDAGFSGISSDPLQNSDTSVRLENVVAIRDIDAAGLFIAAVTITDGNIQADGTLRAATLSYDKLRLGNVLAIQSATAQGAQLKSGVGAGLLPTFVSLTIDGLAAESSTGAGLTVERLALSRRTLSPSGPTRLAARVSGLSLSNALLGDDAASQLAAIGILPMEVSLIGNATWDEARQLADIADLQLTIARAGTVSLAMTATGVTPEVIDALWSPSAPAMARLTALSPLTFGALTLKLTDDGITDRLLASAAETHGLDRQALIDQLLAAVPAPKQSPLQGTLRQELARFLIAPGTLQLSVTPGEGMSAGQLLTTIVLDPTQLPAVLKIDVTAEK